MADPLAHIADPVLERLSAFLDGDLDPAEQADVERALSAAPELRDALDAMRRSQGLVRQHGGGRAPDDFLERVMSAVDREPVPISRARGWRRPMGVPVEIWALAAAAILVVAVGLQARTMDLGGSAEITDGAPSPASRPPETKEEPKQQLAPTKAASKPTVTQTTGVRQGTSDLRDPVLDNAGGTPVYSKAEKELAAKPVPTAVPGTAGTSVIVGEVKGWDYQIKTNDADVIAKLNRVVSKYKGAKLTSMRDTDDGSQSFWVEVPQHDYTSFDADLRKIGVVEGAAGDQLHAEGSTMKLLLRVESADGTANAPPRAAPSTETNKK